jgi:outer membrane lipoprotein SlyB
VRKYVPGRAKYVLGLRWQSSSASLSQNEGVRWMAENNDRNRNGAGDRNATNTAGGDTGEAVGTVGGGLAGAAVGSVFGPLGTVAGGIAGAALGNQLGEGAGAKNARGAGGNGGATNRTEQNKQR